MGEFYDKVAALREYRATAVAALEEIAKGPLITRDGVDVTEQRRRFYRNVLAKLDALIAAYEGVDAPWA